MGHRANYVIIERGKHNVYFYNWGGLSLISDIFYGPEITESFVRSLIPVEDLLTDIWCEGGVLLDYDQKQLMFFSWHILDNPVIVSHYSRLLQITYPGWDIRWATNEIRDICRYIGREMSHVTEEI